MARKKVDSLDQTLELFKRSGLDFAKAIQRETAKLKDEEKLDVHALVDTAYKHTRMAALLIEAAPLLHTRQNIEAIESVKHWLLDSPDIIGEERDRFLDVLTEYQDAVLKKTGYYTPKSSQMRLL